MTAMDNLAECIWCGRTAPWSTTGGQGEPGAWMEIDCGQMVCPDCIEPRGWYLRTGYLFAPKATL